MQAQSNAVLAAVTRADIASPVDSAESLATAFLAGYSDRTRRAYAADLADWARFLERADVEPLAAHRVHVDAYARESERTLTAATIARRLSTLAGFYAYAVDERLCERSPVERVRRPKVASESQALGLDRAQLVAFLEAGRSSGPRDHAMACLLALNGLRIGEVLGADVEHLGRERGHRTVVISRKGGKVQRAVLAPRTAEAVDVVLAGRESGPIFQTASGRRVDRQAAWKVVRRLARSAGIQGAVSPHTLRHGFITAALDAGVSLRDVQDAAGHADPRTTRRYDRGRHSLDRHATYAVSAFLAGDATD